MAVVAVKGSKARPIRESKSKANGGLKANTIVVQEPEAVKRAEQSFSNGSARGGTKRQRRKSRRQSHGSAWHWKQTDSWYYTLPGSKKRVALFDEEGNRVRGVDNKKSAQLAMARVKLGRGWQPEAGLIKSSNL
jgi:hypothetical protein